MRGGAAVHVPIGGPTSAGRYARSNVSSEWEDAPAAANP